MKSIIAWLVVTVSAVPACGGLLPIEHRLDCRGAGGTHEVVRLKQAGFGGLACNIPFSVEKPSGPDYVDDDSPWGGFRNCLEAARVAGLSVWLYDECGYPSLSAGGRTLKGRPELEGTGYLVAVSEIAGGATVEVRVPRGAFRRAVAYPLAADGSFVLERGIDLEKSYRVGKVLPHPPEFELCTPEDAEGRHKSGFDGWRTRPWIGSFRWQAPSGSERWLVFVVTEDFVFEGTQAQRKGFPRKFRHPNVFSAEVTRRYLEVNHAAYARHLGNDLGRYFTATFTDEPHVMAAWWCERPDEVLPSAPELTAAYRAACGRELMDDLPLLVRRGTGSAPVRIDFWSVVAEQYERAFFRPVSDWCRRHGILSGGHLMGEERFNFHVSHYGDFFRCLQALDAPSVDCLYATPSKAAFLTPLFAGSARELRGAKYAMCEASDHAERHEKPFKQVTEAEIRGTLHRLLWGGVNVFTSYFVFSPFDDAALRRLNGEVSSVVRDFLSFGHKSAEIALYYPAQDLMAAYEPHGSTWEDAQLPIKRLERRFGAAADSLFTAGRDFMIVDDRALVESVIEKGEMVHGALRWKALVMPVAEHLPVVVRQKIDEFRRQGGIVYGPKEDPSCAAAVLSKKLPPMVRPAVPTNTLRIAVRGERDERRYLVVQDAPESWQGELIFRDGKRRAMSLPAYGYVLCGHIHSGDHNPLVTEHADGGTTTIRNVSRLNEDYRIAYEPFAVEL